MQRDVAPSDWSGEAYVGKATTIRARRPIAALTRFVDLLVYAENRETPGSVTQFDLLPGPCAWLVFQLDELQQWGSFTAHGGRQRPRLTVTGSHDRPLVTVGRGTTRDVSVRIRPEATSILIGIDGSELRRGDLDLRCMWGGEWRSLGDRLQEIDSPEAAVQLVETVLLRRVLTLTPPREEVRVAVAALSRHAGSNAVSMASDSVGMSPRNLNLLFRRHLGISPKRYARLVRFSRCAGSILLSSCDAGALVARLEFSDDSHFIRDFKSLAGVTPAQLAQRVSRGCAGSATATGKARSGPDASGSWGHFGPMLAVTQ